MLLLAERKGFEPPVPCGTHAFQARTIGHSVIPPDVETTKVGENSALQNLSVQKADKESVNI